MPCLCVNNQKINPTTMNAQEAAQLALQGPSVDIGRILLQIRRAASQGDFSCQVGGPLKPSEIRKLKELGFNAKNTAPRTHGTNLTLISWPQPAPEPEPEEEAPDPDEGSDPDLLPEGDDPDPAPEEGPAE